MAPDGSRTAFYFSMATMAESTLVILFLGVIATCLVLMAATMLLTARDLRRTIRRVHDLLPACERTVREAHLALAHARRLLSRADTISTAVEGMTERAATAASTLMRAWAQARSRAQHWLEGSFGKRNGTRAESRRRFRSS